jgi:predicted DsbA family dithiol-disulfide isomerase
MFPSVAARRWRRFLTESAQLDPETGRTWRRPLPGESGWAPEPGVVWYWYDFLCPFSYVGHDRPGILRSHGLEVIELPLQLHPEIPPGGVAVSAQDNATHESLEQEAREAGLELRWPARLPFSRPALAAAEWVRQHEPFAFPAVQRALFRAHFVFGEDIESIPVIEAHAAASGVSLAFLRAAMRDGSAVAAVARAAMSARSIGVRGTPSWLGPQAP